jgi:hypothetical protein
MTGRGHHVEERQCPTDAGDEHATDRIVTVPGEPSTDVRSIHERRAVHRRDQGRGIAMGLGEDLRDAVVIRGRRDAPHLERTVVPRRHSRRMEERPPTVARSKPWRWRAATTSVDSPTDADTASRIGTSAARMAAAMASASAWPPGPKIAPWLRSTCGAPDRAKNDPSRWSCAGAGPALSIRAACRP